MDHLVVGYSGVAVIDTKNWSQPVSVRGDRLWCGDDDRHEEIEKILALTDAIDDLLIEVAESSPGHTIGLSHVLNNQESPTDGTPSTMFPFVDTGDPPSGTRRARAGRRRRGPRRP